MTQDTKEQKCSNCGHTRCLFHGEDRLPVYRITIQCWVDPAKPPQQVKDERAWL